MTIPILYAALIVATSFTAGGFLSNGHWLVGISLVVLGVTWGYAVFRKWYWFGTIGLALGLSATAAGVWSGLEPGLVFAGALAFLVAWDLGEFDRRIAQAGELDEVRSLERRHLLRLGVVVSAGTAIHLGINFLTPRFSFEWAVALVLMAVWGITRLVSGLQSEVQRGE